MRTKALALTAAISAIGAAAIAGEVTSVNCVGFINLDLKSGYNLIANQLNGPSANNALSVILPSVPAETLLLKFDAEHQTWLTADFFDGSGWINYDTFEPSTTTLSPGEAAFVNVPADTKVTLVGEVPQGDALSVTLAPNYSLASSIVPQQLFLVGSNAFPTTAEMLYLTYNATSQRYNTAAFYDGEKWIDYDTFEPVDVAPAVGQGFFINNPGTAANWTRSFHVQ